jgi:biotin-(acetyl-CoA carboxylase) ligase
VEETLASNNCAEPVVIKWPNDILMNDRKVLTHIVSCTLCNGKQVCGVLIEVERDTILVGIGCNVLTSPEVQKSGDNSGRDAGCIADYICFDDVSEEESDSARASPAIEYRNLLARAIFDHTTQWISDSDSAERVVFECGMKMNFGSVQRLRWDRYSGVGKSFALEEVIPLRLNPDGTLLVR